MEGGRVVILIRRIAADTCALIMLPIVLLAHRYSRCDMEEPVYCNKARDTYMPAMPAGSYGWKAFADMGACRGVAISQDMMAVHMQVPECCLPAAEHGNSSSTPYEKYIGTVIRDTMQGKAPCKVRTDMEATKCTDSSSTLMQGEHLTATNADIKDLGLAVDLIYMHGPITTSKVSDKIQTTCPDITPDQARQLAKPSFDLPIGISIPMLKNIKPTDDAEQRLMEEAPPFSTTKRARAGPSSSSSTELTKLMEAVQGMQQGMQVMQQSLRVMQQSLQGVQQDP